MYALLLQLHPGLDHPDGVHQRVGDERCGDETSTFSLHCTVAWNFLRLLTVTP